jgi:hypothetical protein
VSDTDPEVPNHYSPSQLETWLDCERKWGWRYIDGIKGESTPAAEWGTKAHEMLEKYLRDGTPLDFATDHDMASRVATALEFLPDPGTALPEIVYAGEINGIRWSLRMDYLQTIGQSVWLGDHKTTGDIRYAKTEEQLRTDIQANVYAAVIFHYWPDITQFSAQWEYIQRRGTKKTVPRSLVMYRPEVEQRFSEIEEIVRTIETKRQGVTTATQLPANPASCSKYGGCPYQHLCNLSPEEHLRSIF